MKTRIVIGVLCLSIAFSCSEERQVKPFEYTRVFTGENEKTWVIEEFIIKEAGEEDVLVEFSPCELDDRYTFRADEEKSYVIDNGASECPVPEGEEPEGDIYVEHNWSFVNGGAVLTIAIPRIFGFFLIPFIVKEATSDRMVLEVYANAENTISYQITMKAVAEQ